MFEIPKIHSPNLKASLNCKHLSLTPKPTSRPKELSKQGSILGYIQDDPT